MCACAIGKCAISAQSNLFHSELFSQLDVKDPLIQLANTINWTVFGLRLGLKNRQVGEKWFMMIVPIYAKVSIKNYGNN
jgi:hypothetical protein